MRKLIFAAVAVAGLLACSKPASESGAKGGTSGSAASSSTRSLAAGTTIEATTQRTISSRSDKAGESFTAGVTSDVKDSKGRVVIPAGATLNLSITQLEPASDKSKADGKITVVVSSVTIDGKTTPIDADITSMAHTLKGQGVGAGEVEKTAAGAVVGGIVGRVVGGNAKGTVIGAVIGGAAGAAVAVQSANRDVVVVAGTPIVVTLGSPLSIK
jgi:hypothetical protein